MLLHGTCDMLFTSSLLKFLMVHLIFLSNLLCVSSPSTPLSYILENNSIITRGRDGG